MTPTEYARMIVDQNEQHTASQVRLADAFLQQQRTIRRFEGLGIELGMGLGIRRRLSGLAQQMEAVAAELQAASAPCPEGELHANELLAAAGIVRQWVANLVEDS